MNRIDQLLQFIKDDPRDEFLRYALALEYLKIDPRKASREFETLLASNPNYLPTYYPAAHLLIELGNDKGAAELFTRGIALAQAQGDNKTEMELKSAFSTWQYEKR